MDYKNKYEQALERAKIAYKDEDKHLKATLKRIFPELKESEDERIRKKIIATIHLYYGEPLEDEAKEMIDWLEKQGKYNIGISEATKQKLEDNLNKALEKETPESWNEFLDEQKPYGQREECSNCQMNYAGQCKGSCVMKRRERREQKHKIQPKFKIGDIVGFKGNETLKGETETHKIISYDNELYVFADGTTDLFCEQDLYELVEQNPANGLRPQNVWISVDEEVYVKEPVLAQKKDKSDQFGGFVVCCDHTLTPNVYERYMILGNIVSQNTWKPSDEQMKVLNEVLNFAANHESSHWNDYIFGTLNNLIRQLKKLREE